MNRDLPACADVRALLADHLDGLLDDGADARVREHLSRCPGCADSLGRARTLHAALAAPWAVPAPSADLPLRALASARARASRFGRVTGAALRYAATFAAGALVAFLAGRAAPARPTPPPVDVAAPAPEPALARDAEPVVASFTPRRIR
jgi:predicted anti-sigma-YlaC factor YlaD